MEGRCCTVYNWAGGHFGWQNRTTFLVFSWIELLHGKGLTWLFSSLGTYRMESEVFWLVLHRIPNIADFFLQLIILRFL